MTKTKKKEYLNLTGDCIRFFAPLLTTIFIAKKPFGMEFGFGLPSIKTLLYIFLRTATNHNTRFSDMLIWRLTELAPSCLWESAVLFEM